MMMTVSAVSLQISRVVHRGRKYFISGAGRESSVSSTRERRVEDGEGRHAGGAANLTPEQEKMWPAVEAALRKIVYTKNAMSPGVPAAQPGGERMAYIDPTSADVQQLKYAALPLIKRLNDDQRREVKMMAYVMGLAELASQF
jgi:hypothetical protein